MSSNNQSLANIPNPENLPQLAKAKPVIKMSSRQSRHLAQAVVLEETLVLCGERRVQQRLGDHRKGKRAARALASGIEQVAA